MKDISFYDENILREISKSGDIEKLKCLSDMGVDVFKKDSLGKSAFDYLVEQDLLKGVLLVKYKIESIKNYLDTITDCFQSTKNNKNEF